MKIISFILVLSLGFIYSSFAYQENFDKGEAKGWKVVTGAWDIKDKAYHCAVGKDNDFTFFEESVGNKDWVDYTFTAKVKPVSASNYAGVLFRVIETGVGGPAPGWNTGNFYYWLIGIGSGNVGYSTIWKAMKGSEASLDNANATTLKTGEWSEIKVVIAGNNMKLYLNDKLQKDFTDSSKTIDYGGIGLAGFISEDSFDDIKVEGKGIPGASVNSNDKMAIAWGKIKAK